jgi:hypothetical protein
VAVPNHSADSNDAQLWLSGFLAGAVRAVGGIDVLVEAHEVAGIVLPSFEVTLGRHVLIVHVDTRIA